MICNVCKIQNPHESKYCNQCGSSILNNTVESKLEGSDCFVKEYKDLRLANWVMFVLVGIGMLFVVVNTEPYNSMVLVVYALVAIIFSSYPFSAIAFNKNVSFFMGLPIYLDLRRKEIYYLLFLGNALLCLLGLGVLVACLSTSQLLPAISGLPHLIISIKNMRALKAVSVSINSSV